jgi:hypothetical protein
MNPIKLITLVSCALMFSAPAFAKPKAQATNTPAPAAYSSPTSSSDGSIHWNVAGPLELIDGNVLFGALISGDYFIRNDISVGGESGFMIGSFNGGTNFEFPIVATGKYHFRIASASNLRPFVGLGMGLSILHSSVNTTVGPITVSGSSTDAKFRFEVKGGTSFQQSPGWMAELRMGVVGSGFLFMPSVGYEF